MQYAQSNLFTRQDTFFGVCEALGEDFGIHSNFLRLGFAGLLFFSPLGALAAYAAAGMVVLATRLLVPNPRAASVVEAAGAGQAEGIAAPQGAEPPEPMPLAA